MSALGELDNTDGESKTTTAPCLGWRTCPRSCFFPITDLKMLLQFWLALLLVDSDRLFSFDFGVIEEKSMLNALDMQIDRI